MGAALMPLSVIASNLAGRKDPTGSYKYAYLRHLLSAYKKLHLFLDHEFNVETKILSLDSQVIELPCNFVYETKVALRKNDRTAILTLDRNMPCVDMNQSETINYLDSIFDGQETAGGLYYPFYNSEIIDLCGYGLNVNHRGGFYNINKKNGTIEFGSMIPSDVEVVIEYKSDGVSEGLELVPSETEDVLGYDARSRFWEDEGDLGKAQYFDAKYKENYYMLKRLWNFRSALYIAQTAYNYTSEI